MSDRQLMISLADVMDILRNTDLISYEADDALDCLQNELEERAYSAGCIRIVKERRKKSGHMDI